AGQISDITMSPNVAGSWNIVPYYVSFPSTAGNCGISARSTVPGTTVHDTYGCPGPDCKAHTAPEFAAVGSAYPVPTSSVAPNRSSTGVKYVPLAFDGSAPAGTHGFLELAFKDDEVGQTYSVFARVPIYVPHVLSTSGWNRVTSSTATVYG